MDPVVLTFLGFFLNAAVASGKYTDITLDVVRSRIDDGTIFDFLEERLDRDIQLSIMHNDDRAELLTEWQRLNNAATASQFRIFTQANGLALLVAYLLEGIQTRMSTVR